MNTSKKSVWSFLSIFVGMIALYTLIPPVVESAGMSEMDMKIDAKNIETSMAAFIKPSKGVLKKSLTKLQYEVTQEEGTERAYSNEYWNNKETGIYVDIVSGEPLFSSKDKYDSKTGWPSFSQPISGVTIVERVDKKLFYSRTELRSQLADSHLGHIFDDGPEPTGKRYCINSASLKFIPKNEMKTAGYEKLIGLLD